MMEKMINPEISRLEFKNGTRLTLRDTIFLSYENGCRARKETDGK